jgi:origin recognition complex subunit 1
MKIIQSRLEGVPGGIVESDAVQFASRKVAAVSGDARRALDICRRAVELAETESQSNGAIPATPSKTQGKQITMHKSLGSLGKVTIGTIKRAINEATSSPLQQHLRGLALSSKLLLAALVAKVRRSGLGESVMGEILEEARRIAKMAVETKNLEYLLMDIFPVSSNGKPLQGASTKMPPRVYGIGAAAIELMEAGVIALEARKGDRMGKIRLCIGEEDVKQAFKEDPEGRGLGF